jgi:hypothetical protein
MQRQNNLRNDFEFQNAIWFGQELMVMDSNGDLIENDIPISFDADAVKCKNGMYLREACSFVKK